MPEKKKAAPKKKKAEVEEMEEDDEVRFAALTEQGLAFTADLVALSFEGCRLVLQGRVVVFARLDKPHWSR